MNPTYDTIDKLSEQFTAQVMEHAESVLVLVTWREGGQSHIYSEDAGNYYANLGSADGWFSAEKEKAIKHALKRKEI